MSEKEEVTYSLSLPQIIIQTGISYAGRLVTDPLNTMARGETSLFAGSGSQVAIHRWGDYSSMAVDPVDNCTFWYTSEYLAETGVRNWHTRIGSFTFSSCVAPKGK